MKNINIIIVTIITIIVALCFRATAQQSQLLDHGFSFYVGGGISTLNYSPTTGSTNLGLGGLAGLGYTFRFNERWGFGTGMEAALFNGKCSLDPQSETYLRNDGTEDFDYTYTLTGYRDKQQVILLNIPLMLRFQTDMRLFNLTAMQGFYAALGGKVGIPLSASFSSSADKLSTEGQYASGEFVLNKPNFMGFGEFTNDLSHKGDLVLQTAFFASAEVGLKWRLTDKLSLSSGLYFDYGLNNIRPSAAAPLIDYSGSDDYKPNSVLTSTNAGKSLVDKLNSLAAGIKIGIVFGAPSGKAAKATHAPVSTTPDPAPLEAEHQHKAAGEKRLAETELLTEQEREEKQKLDAEERLVEEKHAEEERLAEEQRTEEKRLAEEVPIAEQKRAEELVIVKEKIQQRPADSYTSNSTELSTQQKGDLDEKADLLLQFYPDKHIVIEGHTCNLGTHAVNVLIAQKRADNAKAYLIKKGIAANRITTVSKAETEPLLPNTSEANKRKNRRVVVLIGE